MAYSKSDVQLAEVHDIDTNEVLRVTLSRYSDDGTAFLGQVSGIRKYDLQDEGYYRIPKPLPDEHVYPLAPREVTIYEPQDLEKFHIKRINLVGFDYASIANLVPNLLLHEVEILELLKLRQHPNVVRYHGCILKGERIAGIVLTKYPETLHEYVQRRADDSDNFKSTRLMEGLSAGVQHLHSMGLAHNDLNPMNIAIDDSGNAVVIDFGSCKRFGQDLVSAGTPGWVDEASPDWAVSAKAHDEYALQKIEAWLEDMRLGSVSNEYGKP